MFGGQQEVRYLELSPYCLTLPPKNAYPTDILTTIKQTSNGETTACKSQGCGWSQGDVAFKNEQTPE